MGGHQLSAKQLDELWHLDFTLAHELMCLPLRKCTAIPSEWGTPMPEDDFRRLKVSIRRMWLRAALIFSCERSGESWGLKVNEDHERNV
jgi:hypothetical protein